MVFKRLDMLFALSLRNCQKFNGEINQSVRQNVSEPLKIKKGMSKHKYLKIDTFFHQYLPDEKKENIFFYPKPSRDTQIQYTHLARVVSDKMFYILFFLHRFLFSSPRNMIPVNKQLLFRHQNMMQKNKLKKFVENVKIKSIVDKPGMGKNK